MKLKVVTDGTNKGTRVLNAETGEEVQNVTKVTIDFDGHKPPSVEIHMFDCSVEIEAREKGLVYEGHAEMVFKGTGKEQ